jgi:hypothetical protein
MENKLVELQCMSCNKTYLGEEPKYCCNGKECGCMGMPIEPEVCSAHCYYNLLVSDYLIWININDKLQHQHYLYGKEHDINIIVRYEYPIIGFENKNKEVITTVYYNKEQGFYTDYYDFNFNEKYITHYMFLPASPI